MSVNLLHLGIVKGWLIGKDAPVTILSSFEEIEKNGQNDADSRENITRELTGMQMSKKPPTAFEVLNEAIKNMGATRFPDIAHEVRIPVDISPGAVNEVQKKLKRYYKPRTEEQKEQLRQTLARARAVRAAKIALPDEPAGKPPGNA